MKKIILASISLLFLSSATFFIYKAMDKKYIAFSEANTMLLGRYEYANDGISFSQSGTAITFLTDAETIPVLIENNPIVPDSITNWFTVLVNNSFHSRLFLKPGKQYYEIVLPESSTGVKYISFIKSTESFVGEVKFYGVEIPVNNKLENIDERFFSDKLKIQFIGNSITCGYGIMASIAASPDGDPNVGFHAVNENAYETYAMRTARNLDAFPMLVSYSGIGLYRNGNNDTSGTLPKIYDRVHLQKESSAIWDHKKQVPQIIVINLGTNDYAGESRGLELNDSVFVKTYIDFMDRLLGLYPSAKIICTNGPMLTNSWPHGRNNWSRVRDNIEKVEKHFFVKRNKKVFSFFYTPQKPPYGENYHPSLATHAKMAEELTTFIQTVVNK